MNAISSVSLRHFFYGVKAAEEPDLFKSADLAKLLHFGHGKIFECRVTQVDPTAHLEHMVHAMVLVRDMR